MADYYFSITGNDTTGEGTQLLPWQTLSKLNGLTLAAGDNVYFKCGDVWTSTSGTDATGKIVFDNSGSAGSPITYGSYSSGDKPMFRGHGDNLATSWTDLGGGVYFWAYAGTTYNGFMEDNVYLLEATSQAEVAAGHGQWWKGTGTNGDGFYYKPTTGVPGDHRLTKLTAISCASSGAAVTYIVIQDMAFSESYGGIYFAHSSSNIIIRRCLFDGALRAAFFNQGASCTISDVLIEDVEVMNFKTGLTSDAASANYSSANFTFRRCIVHDCDHAGWVKLKYDGSSGRSNNTFPDWYGICTQNANSCIVEDCVLYDIGHAVANKQISCFEWWHDATSPNGTMTNNIIRRNFLYNFYSYAIQIGNSASVSVTGNKIYHNIIMGTGTDGTSLGIDHCGVRCGMYDTDNTSNLIYNNTIYNCQFSLDFSTGGVTGVTVENNISLNPAGGTYRHVRTKASFASIINYNDFYPDGGTLFYDGSTASNLAGFADKGANDRISDPGFTVVNGDVESVKPAADSPARDAGAVIIGSLRTDYFQNPRVGDAGRGAIWYIPELVPTRRYA